MEYIDLCESEDDKGKSVAAPDAVGGPRTRLPSQRGQVFKVGLNTSELRISHL